MQAVVEARRTRPDWTAYLIPMALKYRYREPIAPILERRTRSMERRLHRRMSGLSLQRRLVDILADLLHRQELAHHLKPDADRLTALSERVQEMRKAILSQTEEEYAGATVKSQAQTMDRAWRLSSSLRNLLAQVGRFRGKSRRRSAKTWRRRRVSPRWGAGSRSTWIWTRRRSGWRKWSSNWSARSTRSNARTSGKSRRLPPHRRFDRPRTLHPGLSPGCPSSPPSRRGTTPRSDPGAYRHNRNSNA